MQGLFVLGRFLVETALLWFLMVWVTREQEIPGRQVAVWVVMTLAVGLIGVGLSHATKILPYSLCLLIGMFLQILTLWLILRREGLASAKVTVILILFLVVRGAIAVPGLVG